MIDTARAEWPAEMRRAADHPDLGTIETMAHDTLDSLRRYVREQPETAVLWALGIGFVLGWRLKPW
jgi:hypothetical protein